MKELSYKSLSCSSELIYRFKKRSGKIQKQGCGKTNSLSEETTFLQLQLCNHFRKDMKLAIFSTLTKQVFSFA